jgi:hypothetical protein
MPSCVSCALRRVAKVLHQWRRDFVRAMLLDEVCDYEIADDAIEAQVEHVLTRYYARMSGAPTTSRHVLIVKQTFMSERQAASGQREAVEKARRHTSANESIAISSPKDCNRNEDEPKRRMTMPMPMPKAPNRMPQRRPRRNKNESEHVHCRQRSVRRTDTLCAIRRAAARRRRARDQGRDRRVHRGRRAVGVDSTHTAFIAAFNSSTRSIVWTIVVVVVGRCADAKELCAVER